MEGENVFWILFLVFVLILIIIGVFVFISFGSSNSAGGLCSSSQLNTPAENWTAYQANPATGNPFFLVSENAEGPFHLHMKNITEEDCYACGSTYIPHPKFCQINSRFSSEVYQLNSGSAGTGGNSGGVGISSIEQPGSGQTTATYVSETGTITLGPSCQTPIGSGLTGVPLTRWTATPVNTEG